MSWVYMVYNNIELSYLIKSLLGIHARKQLSLINPLEMNHERHWVKHDWAYIIVQVTIYRRVLIGRDGHLDQSEAYDIS